MRTLESTVNCSETTVKELINALKTLNPDMPVYDFKLRNYRSCNDKAEIVNIYDLEFSLQEEIKK